MASNDNSRAGEKLRIVLVYLGLGVATFAVVSVWVFAGLKLWGHNG